MTTVLLVVGILVFLIVAHEFGHFIVSKIFRVHVEEFGIGYPPRAFTLGIWGGTEYTINWLPFGGFVRLFGEHGETHQQGSFAGAPKYAQAAILVAGVAANALAAWFLFAGALHMGIPRVIPEGKAIGSDARLIVNMVVDNSPAAVAGFKPGDEIKKIEDSEGASPDLRPSAVVAFIGSHGGKPLEVTYLRAGEESSVKLIPAHAVVEENANRPAIGVGLALVTDAKLSWLRALKEALFRAYDALRDSIAGLHKLGADAFAGNPSLEGVVGPVGLVGFVGNASQHGFGYVLDLAGFISINLAIINLIPIPALDGGRLFLLGIETIIRRPPHKLTVQIMNFLGVILIVMLMVAVTYKDIVRLLT